MRLLPEPSTRRLLLGIALAWLVGSAIVWAATLQRIEHDLAQTIRNEVRQNDNLALAFEQHSVRTLAAVDEFLYLMAREYRLHGSVDLDEGRIADGSIVTHVLIADEKGEVVA